MTPTLSELLKGLRDCRNAAQEYSLGEVDTCHMVDYKAGHAAACSVLIPVIEEVSKLMRDNCGCIPDTRPCRMCYMNDLIRSLLEKAVKP
jgi:hypothetical protein